MRLIMLRPGDQVAISKRPAAQTNGLAAWLPAVEYSATIVAASHEKAMALEDGTGKLDWLNLKAGDLVASDDWHLTVLDGGSSLAWSLTLPVRGDR